MTGAPSNSFLLDTHTLLWLLTDPSKLEPAAVEPLVQGVGVHVGDEQVEQSRSQRVGDRGETGAGHHVVTLALEQPGQCAQQIDLVVDDRDARHGSEREPTTGPSQDEGRPTRLLTDVPAATESSMWAPAMMPRPRGRVHAASSPECRTIGR